MWAKMHAPSLDSAGEPLRLLAGANAESLSAAMVLFAALRDADRRTCLSVIDYNDDVLAGLLLEDYGHFVFLNCTHSGFKEKFSGKGVFLDTKEAYNVAKDISSNSVELAHIIVAGAVGKYLEGGVLEIDNEILSDALGRLSIEIDGFAEVDEQLLQQAVVKGEKEISLRLLLDMAELLNACIAFDRPALALVALVGHEQAKDEAVALLAEYRRELSHVFEWCEKKKGSSSIITGNGYVIVNGSDKVMPSMVCRLATQLAREWAAKHAFIMVMARNTASMTTFALRMAGRRGDVHLVELLERITSPLECTVSGGAFAADGAIKSELEERFIKAVCEALEQAFLEEFVVR